MMFKRYSRNPFFLLMSAVGFLLLTAVPGFCGRVALTTIFVEQDIPIATCQELQDMQNGLTKKYHLTCDVECKMTNPSSTGNADPQLDFDPFGTWGDGKGFKPVSTFTGNFDGRGYKIKDLYIDRKGISNIGLFGSVGAGAEIMNIGLVNVEIKGDDTGPPWDNNRGSLCGKGDSFKISNSYSTGGALSGNAQIGGLVGWAENGEITNSYFKGDTKGFSNTAGLVGLAEGTEIANSYSEGSVTGAAFGAGRNGGLVGQFSNCTIKNSYSRSSVSSVQDGGGLVGWANAGTITNSYSTGSITSLGGSVGGLIGHKGTASVSNCYWDTETALPATTSDGGTGKTTAQMKQKATYQPGDPTHPEWDWDFDSIWGIDEDATYPYFN